VVTCRVSLCNTRCCVCVQREYKKVKVSHNRQRWPKGVRVG